MRGTLERSADAWASRAELLDRLETNFNARAEAYGLEQNQLRAEREDDGQGTGSIEQGETQAESQGGQAEKRARPRIQGLSSVQDWEGRTPNAD